MKVFSDLLKMNIQDFTCIKNLTAASVSCMSELSLKRYSSRHRCGVKPHDTTVQEKPHEAAVQVVLSTRWDAQQQRRTDSGLHTCSPSDIKQALVSVHTLNAADPSVSVRRSETQWDLVGQQPEIHTDEWSSPFVVSWWCPTCGCGLLTCTDG